MAESTPDVAVEHRTDSSEPSQRTRANGPAHSAADPAVSTLGYGTAWLAQLLRDVSGLDFDEGQVRQVAQLADRKMADLFDVAEEIADANGRSIVRLEDLPLTKGLRRLVQDVSTRAFKIEGGALRVFLADAGIHTPIEERLRDEIPRLHAALLVLTGRIVALLEPANLSPLERIELLTRTAPTHPTTWELDRTERLLDMTL